MILVVGHMKGGVGKTTLSVNIAIARSLAGRDVLLVDGDEQKTASTFHEIRKMAMKKDGEEEGKAGYTLASYQGKQLRTEIAQMRDRFDDIVIDCGGKINDSLRAALSVADTLLVPVQPRSFDIWANDPLTELLDEARAMYDFRTVMVINLADSVGRDNDEAAEAIKDDPNVELLPVTIGRRKSFPNAASQGKSVLELATKDKKAIDELNALVAALYPQTEAKKKVANGRR